MSGEDIDILCINTIRSLTIDAIEKAKSGHPGAAMGIAPVAYALWTRFLRHNPSNPSWPGRDRFILSAGHASMLLYSLLYLTGYSVTLEDIKNFRQLGSPTPGHPEYGRTPGIEMTTGPLGQGIASAVGMALARKILGARFNRPGFDLTEYYIFVICSDGDLMEGVSSEACSLAGHLGLDHFVCLYDDNKITIEGCTDLCFSEDVEARFRSYGWEVFRAPDANDINNVANLIEKAMQVEGMPSLLIVSSKLACGSPNLEGSEKAHGAPLGPEEARLTKANLGFDPDNEFFVPEAVLNHMRKAVEKGRVFEAKWQEKFEEYAKKFPDDAREWNRVMKGVLPAGWKKNLPSFAPESSIATRSASGKVLQALAKVIPELIGGSADLGPSNNTLLPGYESIRKGHYSGRNLHFGVREHGMAAMVNGMARHGGLIPYCGTFLVFSDYMRPSMRLAAMMGLHIVYVFTHDSLGVGEDGPTHQPVEQISSLRAVPGLTVIRPADANEVVVAWELALERKSPTALILTRQNVPVLDRKDLADATNLRRGGYVLYESKNSPKIIIIATGSEVSLALEAVKKLEKGGVWARLVNMGSWEIFEEQEKEYKESVLPPAIRHRLVVEAGVSHGWGKYLGLDGKSLCVERFGLSAPGTEVMREFGFTVDNLVSLATQLVEKEVTG